ncbi:NADH oxidase [BD1-7 clade bacterium]|uniref:NADH oxidase n=1 Tax=BD1-7 clade bacterium TaxID=2029982 RepID=A0A5S9QXB5_9GAMM|nr:NADH oxidase [BD1-7 clade bacterium]
MSELIDKCFSPAKINSLELRNRVIKAATFEGKTPDAVPTERLIDFHMGIAEGGTAMTTLAYCGAEADGRLAANMMYMGEYIRDPLTSMIQRIQSTGCKVSGQLAHCGGFSKNKELTKRRPKGPSFTLNMLGAPYGMFFAGGMNAADMEDFVSAYAEAATFMKSVGFDCIELHFGHGYGLSQFISPLTNRRKDEYGGSLTNRMRMPLRVLDAVRRAVGDDFPIIGKISLTDGVRGGINYDDAVEIASMLDKAGIDGIVTSGGTSSFNPMLMFRGDNMSKTMLEYEKNPMMRLVLRALGNSFFRNYPYEETYFLEQAKRVRDKVDTNVIYIGGVSTNESIEKVMGAGFDFIQLGRTLIADPSFVKNASADLNYKNPCTHCNQCVGLIDSPEGTHCVLPSAMPGTLKTG